MENDIIEFIVNEGYKELTTIKGQKLFEKNGMKLLRDGMEVVDVRLFINGDFLKYSIKKTIEGMEDSTIYIQKFYGKLYTVEEVAMILNIMKR
jgi:hypothetical protein